MIKRRKYPAKFADLFSRRDLLKRAVELSKKRGIKFGIVEHPGRGEPPAVQGANNLDSCFRRNDNVAVAATVKQKTLGETQG